VAFDTWQLSTAMYFFRGHANILKIEYTNWSDDKMHPMQVKMSEDPHGVSK
jgi:hypothetical protein